MRVFIAGLGTETNTFISIPTGEQTFLESQVTRNGSRERASLSNQPLIAWRKAAEAHQMQLSESLLAFAKPGGVTVRTVYEGYRDEILDDLRAALPLDIVLLNMHGAMVAEGYDDCEGDLLARVRAIVGPRTIVGGELDLHCHISDAMVENADVLITYKEYPHIDAGERADELFAICRDAAAGRVKPTLSLYDCRMVNMWRTPVEPMASFVAEMQGREGRDGILSVSFGHGFPWGDVAEVGARMLVVSDGDREKGDAVARDFAMRLRAIRQQTDASALGIDEALDRALAAPAGPIVLADVADNAGGGAPSDSTFILRRLLERGIGDVITGCYWDPVAVRFCMEAGEGACFDLRIGGKVGPVSGDPVDLRITVKRIVKDAMQSFGDGSSRMGDAVWVEGEGIDIVLNSLRTQTFNPNAYTQFGLDPGARKIVVVKSTQHFYAGFAPIAAEVLYVATPSAIPPDFATIAFTKRDGNYWPRIEDPWGED